MLDPTHPLSTMAAELARRWWLGPGVFLDHPAIDPRARESLADEVTRAFHRQVAHLAARTLLTEFHTFRESLGLPADRQSQTAVQAYRAHLADPAHRAAVLDRHPALGQLVARIAAEQITFVRHVLQAFDDDADMLCAAGLLGINERVTGLEFVPGDTYRDGRSVIVVRTNSGEQLVYKPRSLAPDCAIRAFWAALDPGLRYSIAGCVPLSVDRGEYGWQWFVPQDRAMTLDACARYFYRLGAVIAAAGMWGATVLHRDSVVTHGEHPVLIDLKTILQPQTPALDALDPHTEGVPSSNALRTMLASRDEDTVMDALPFGLEVPGQQTSGGLVFQVSEADSDAMAIPRQPWSVPQDSNVPLIDGEPQDPIAWCADLRSGMRDALVALRRYQADTWPGAAVRACHDPCAFPATEVQSRSLMH